MIDNTTGQMPPMAASNRPGCPPWCATDHAAGLPVCESDGYRLKADTPVSAYARRLRGLDHLSVGTGSRRLHLTDAGDVPALAAIVEALAGTTPEQHREIADAIRRQAALLGWEAPTPGEEC